MSGTVHLRLTCDKLDIHSCQEKQSRGEVVLKSVVGTNTEVSDAFILWISTVLSLAFPGHPRYPE
jgi:hypothetical protein